MKKILYEKIEVYLKIIAQTQNKNIYLKINIQDVTPSTDQRWSRFQTIEDLIIYVYTYCLKHIKPANFLHESDFFQIKIKSNQLHVVSRTQQDRQRKPSVNTQRSPLFAGFWRHCVLSGGTQRCALPRHQREEMEILI